MRAICPIFVLALMATAAERPPLDIVLLLEDSQGVSGYVQRTDLQALRPGDRVAVMVFAKKTRLRLPLSGDFRKVQRAVLGPRSYSSIRAGFRTGAPGKAPMRLWDALIDACAAFGDKPDPARRRAIVVLFGDENASSKATFEGARRAVIAARAAVSAAAVAKREPIFGRERNVQTPPTTRGGAPVSTRLGPVPDATLEGMKNLAVDTRGSVMREDWDLSKLIEQVRNQR